MICRFPLSSGASSVCAPSCIPIDSVGGVITKKRRLTAGCTPCGWGEHDSRQRTVWREAAMCIHTLFGVLPFVSCCCCVSSLFLFPFLFSSFCSLVLVVVCRVGDWGSRRLRHNERTNATVTPTETYKIKKPQPHIIYIHTHTHPTQHINTLAHSVRSAAICGVGDTRQRCPTRIR